MPILISSPVYLLLRHPLVAYRILPATWKQFHLWVNPSFITTIPFSIMFGIAFLSFTVFHLLLLQFFFSKSVEDQEP